MKVFGMDFTSAPSRRKPITLAVCSLDGATLQVLEERPLPDFAAFETVLAGAGPWVAGLDFPFGQPRRLIERVNWPLTWEGYVEHASALGKHGFEEAIQSYSAARPAGDKQHRRAADVLADARSPMMLVRVPVGKMFFQGTPRLLRSGCSIVPVRPTDDDRIVIEAYPALVARRWTGRVSYKTDTRSKQSKEKEAARRQIVAGLRSPEFAVVYGFSVALPADRAEQIILDPSGDRLDALLSAIQAGWAHLHRHEGYGVPADCDVLEGWILDPSLSPHLL